MKLLVTNDDGVSAEGLRALHEIAVQLGNPTVLAPESLQSGCSHRITMDRPMRVTDGHPSWFSLDGTPADCVRVALDGHVDSVDWVLSGINEGANLGVDVYYSGTVAAVREGVFHGIPGIAISHYRKAHSGLDWEMAVELLVPLVQDLMNRSWTPGSFWNVNLPDMQASQSKPEIVFCNLDLSPLPLGYEGQKGTVRYSGNYHRRTRVAGGDVDVCMGGNIAVTLITL